MPPESRHAATERAFHAALWTPAPPTGLAAPDASEIGRRFAVYRNNVQHGLTRALAARFPVVEKLVGRDFFAAMARVFIAAHPPRTPVLLGWGADFPDFVETFLPAGRLPYLADVARLEMARGRAYHADDAVPITPGRLTGVDPERLRLRLHPALQLFGSPHPAVGIWSAHQTDAAPKPVRARGPEHALIGREPGFAVVVVPIDPDTHALFAALAEGIPLGRAADGQDPTAGLALLLRHGLIVAIEEGKT